MLRFASSRVCRCLAAGLHSACCLCCMLAPASACSCGLSQLGAGWPMLHDSWLLLLLESLLRGCIAALGGCVCPHRVPAWVLRQSHVLKDTSKQLHGPSLVWVGGGGRGETPLPFSPSHTTTTTTNPRPFCVSCCDAVRGLTQRLTALNEDQPPVQEVVPAGCRTRPSSTGPAVQCVCATS